LALILLRHARPDAAEGRCYGRIDLDPGAGVAAAAAEIAARVRPIDRIVTSPLRRCRRLAAALGARLGAPVRLDPVWREIDFGRWEGLAWETVSRAELDAWAADLLHARPHGGESVAMLLVRARRAVRRFGGTGGRTLVVTHAGMIRAALVATGAGADAWRQPIAFGELVALDSPRRRIR